MDRKHLSRATSRKDKDEDDGLCFNLKDLDDGIRHGVVGWKIVEVPSIIDNDDGLSMNLKDLQGIDDGVIGWTVLSKTVAHQPRTHGPIKRRDKSYTRPPPVPNVTKQGHFTTCAAEKRV